MLNLRGFLLIDTPGNASWKQRATLGYHQPFDIGELKQKQMF